MPPKTEGPPIIVIILMILWFVFMVGGYLAVLVAVWRAMRALEKIADKLQTK